MTRVTMRCRGGSENDFFLVHKSNTKVFDDGMASDSFCDAQLELQATYYKVKWQKTGC